MKKSINLCIAIIALVGLSFSVNAQGTGIAPNVGSTHPYSVVNDDANTYQWFVTANYGDIVDSAAPDYDPGAGVASLSATTGNAINITWGTAAVGTTYFVHVIETVTATSCSNHKVLAVTPVNGFNLVIAAVSSTDVELTTVTELAGCAPNVIVSGYDTDARTFEYDYGNNIFYYKITASGIGNNGWSPQLTINKTDTDAIYTAQWATAINGTYTGNDLTVDNVMNDITVDANNASIWVKLTVDNAEGLSDNPIVITLLDDAGTSVDANNNNVNTITGTNDVSTQTVTARPTVTGITTD